MAPYKHSPTDPDTCGDSETASIDVTAPGLSACLADSDSELDMLNMRASLAAIESPPSPSSSHFAAGPSISSTWSIVRYYEPCMSLDLAAIVTSQQHIINALEDIYRFFISIGAAEIADIAFGPHNLTYDQVNLLANSGFSPEAVMFLNMLPIPDVTLSLDWNSPALRYFRNFDEDTESLRFIDLRTARECEWLAENDLDELTGHEVPLTEYHPGSLGFHWVINVDTGLLTRRYLRKHEGEEWENPYKGNNANANAKADTSAQKKTDGDDDLLAWNGDAVQLLQEYLACLKNLEMIPIKLWTERDLKPGFVTQSESVYGDVKAKLLEYGWPDAFRRGDWVRDLPGLVKGWKCEKMRRLEVVEAGDGFEK